VNIDTLKPGTYRLTKDLPALTPDARVKHDWRCAPMKKGRLFYVVEATYVDSGRRAWLEISSGEWAHKCVRPDRHPELVEALEAVGERPSTWLRRESCGDHVAVNILDHLVGVGTITLEQVQQAYADCYRREPS
jgi:hypothetical protein